MRSLLRLSALELLALAATGCFPTEAGPRLAHFDELAPQIGALAPPSTFVTADGSAVTLSSLLDGRPLVIQLGSHSCPVYRYRRHSLRPVWERFADRVRFVLLYTREAHPVGAPSPYLESAEWDPWINRLARVRVLEHRDLEDRLARARQSRAELELPLELFVDTFDNAAWRAFGAAASPAFVLDPGGRIVLRQVWVEPEQLAETLDQLLLSEGIAPASSK